ncbi:MAG: PDZ domain-containing protein [Sphingobacteriales bacterium]|nr:PDZ domain-containing protein [Sphingobacteriales bacterium]
MRRILLLIFCQCISTLSYCQNIFGFSYYTNEEDSVIVTKVFKNSPADKAGLKVGDFLNFINDIPLSF